MSRVALYRKYRSADFDEVIGQDHVVRTLQNALDRDLISHAYLLTGPRGVGKTSVARILARRVNSLPAEAAESSHLDIIEIDAASNRGIDEIRELRERIASAPTALKYKVYIIDEVHMLTREAFNALLKTLEEPPGHVIFILATTEAHKLPDTILSRTQRFDFRPIHQSALAHHLKKIAQTENITIDDAALAVIARHSAGSFRDGISLLDQLSSSNMPIDSQLVYDILGLSSEDQIARLAQVISDHDPAKAAQILDQILGDGADPQALTGQLIEHLRQQFLQAAQDKDLLKAQDLINMTNRLNLALRDFKNTVQYSLPLELAVYELAVAQNQYEPKTQSTTEDNSKDKPSVKASSTTTSSNSSKQDPTSTIDRYTKALSYIKSKNNSLYAVLKLAEMELDNDILRLAFSFSFHKDRVEEHKNRALIEAVMSKVYDRPIELVCTLTSSPTKPVDAQAELVATALEILGGEVVDGN